MNARTPQELLDLSSPDDTTESPLTRIHRIKSKHPHLQLCDIKSDTHEIVSIYLQRPSRLAQMRLSQWFCLAHGLPDWELQCAASAGECKSRMIYMGYTYLSLQPLQEFNKREHARDPK